MTSTLEDELSGALARDELRLLYQPVVALDTRGLAGVEALLRWQHPDLGLLPPGAFLSDAEASGAIVEVGAWVIDEACRQAAAWRAELGRAAPLPIHVNISGRQLDGTLADTVVGAMSRAGIGPSALALEVTETALIEREEEALEALRRLEALGVTLLLDDFGVGWSSLSYLRRLPADVVKVDRSFVAGLGVSADDEGLMAAIVGMCHSLGRRVLAEGIETEQQLRRAAALGCALGQGFHLGRPVPAAAIPGIVRRAGRRPAAWAGSPGPHLPDPLGRPARLDVLRRTALLDSPQEASFDRLAGMVARLLDAPVGLVSLVEEDRQFFKAAVGLEGTSRQTPLSHSFCQHVVRSAEPLVVEDARGSELLRDNPAIADFGVIAYAGAPLTAGGEVLGSLCALDHRPRAWTDSQQAALEDLAALASAELELRLAQHDIARQSALIVAHRRVLELSGSGTPLRRTLAALLGAIEDQLDGHRCVVTLYGADGMVEHHGQRGACAAVEMLSAELPAFTAGAERRSRPAEVTSLDGQGELQACVSAPLLGSGGQVTGIFHALRTIDGEPSSDDTLLVRQAAELAALAVERNRQQHALDAERRRVQAILANSPLWGWVKDRSGRYLEVNSHFLAESGLGADDVLGRTASEVWGEEAGATIDALDERVWRSGQPLSLETSLLLPSGERSFFDARFLLPGADGRPEALCGIGMDITERVRLQEERLALEVRLQQAARLESLGRLAGGIAHDFNNVLGVVRTYAELLAKRLGDSQEVREIRTAAEHAARLTAQLVAFGRGQDVEPRPVDVATSIRTVTKLLAPGLGDGVSLRTDADDAVGCVSVGDGQLDQVLVNLVVNAAEAMKDGGEIEVAARRLTVSEDDAPEGMVPGSHVELTVADRGCGIDPALSGRAFEPFVTTKRGSGGTGLGLATVQGIVAGAGGDVRLEPRGGGGCVARVRLPAVSTGPAGGRDGRGDGRGARPPMLLVGGQQPALPAGVRPD